MTTLDELLNWCSSLVRKSLQSDELELAHFTVKEYLMGLNESCGADMAQYRMSVDHTDISRTCFRFLGLSEFDGTPLPVTDLDPELSGFDEAWRDFEGKYTFMEYVLRYWHVHAHKSSWDEIEDGLWLLFDESSSSYRLWTFGNLYYHAMDHSSNLERERHSSPLSSLKKVTGPSGPSALHWAAVLALPNICTVLITRGVEVNASSILGSPIYCATMGFYSFPRRMQIMVPIRNSKRRLSRI
ncbi:hypothetical protein OCU04_008370 [Sclerotinia nivalis]|uniref:Ankyrin repeat protein n=1 Tax=Sclerotinia nivalis TaxID=352851 RepID=A0A9X0AI02_9HELO|nr:hypothetical protein OCU04_008370 [Sclerotinia nivalis]